ncbi:MAG: ASPIC/UnbV domain-containing protein, partial [Parvularculaceae bacterium]|nr:ASPIC/UnbV domain-containing protein [Parvularculaceae bacterium]
QTNGWFADESPERPYVEDPSHLWTGDGSGGFTDLATDGGVADTEQGRGVVCDDFDGDGDVDALLTAFERQQQQFLWINQGSTNNYLKVRLAGAGTNTDAVGSRVSVTADGVTQYRDVGINSGFISHSSTELHFGLGEATSITQVGVTWPDGTRTMLTSADVNSTLVIQQP